MAKTGKKKGKPGDGAKVTRYTYEDIKEPRTPETGHTGLLPSDEQVVTLPMDNGWTKAAHVGKLPDDERPVIVDMDPAVDPILFWAGKRNKREVPVLPLQRNEIVAESRIKQIIDRARRAAGGPGVQAELSEFFADLERQLRESEKDRRVEFYTHDEGWKNKLICGDSLQVIESLLNYEGMRGQVQTIYFDPPYGIKYNSNFQQRVDSTKNDEKDRADDILTIKAYRDTWMLGVHSYLSYLHERLYACRELLAESGSVFVQISDDNVHLVRALLDEVFGRTNHMATIVFATQASSAQRTMDTSSNFILWYAKNAQEVKYNPLFVPRRDESVEKVYTQIELPDGTTERFRSDRAYPAGSRRLQAQSIYSRSGGKTASFTFKFQGREFVPPSGYYWSTNEAGLKRMAELGRLLVVGRHIRRKVYLDDFAYSALTTTWPDTMPSGFAAERIYAVQTTTKVVERCILLTTDPGDLVFDPTTGSGTTAFCAEAWGRRWITCDTSRVSVNVARQRLLGAVFDHFKTKNGRVSGGFVYKQVPRITLKSLAQDMEAQGIDLVDQPEVDRSTLRVTGPFEVMSLGRYSVEDWRGYVNEGGKLHNYVETICRLYRKDAAPQSAAGLVHAVAESEKDKVAISVGPLSGRVTAKQINDAVQDAMALGVLDVHILGWAFEANVGEVKSQLESRGKVKIQLVMIRPDTLAEGLKVTNPDQLFSPLALPDIDVDITKGKNPNATVTLKGVGVFDRKKRSTEYYAGESGYIAAWYLDEDYDGDCFVDCQMFFDFAKTPNIKAALKAEVEPDEFKLRLTSEPFAIRGNNRIAVKVVDVYGNESTIVRPLT